MVKSQAWKTQRPRKNFSVAASPVTDWERRFLAKKG